MGAASVEATPTNNFFAGTPFNTENLSSNGPSPLFPPSSQPQPRGLFQHLPPRPGTGTDHRPHPPNSVPGNRPYEKWATESDYSAGPPRGRGRGVRPGFRGAYRPRQQQNFPSRGINSVRPRQPRASNPRPPRSGSRWGSQSQSQSNIPPLFGGSKASGKVGNEGSTSSLGPSHAPQGEVKGHMSAPPSSADPKSDTVSSSSAEGDINFDEDYNPSGQGNFGNESKKMKKNNEASGGSDGGGGGGGGGGEGSGAFSIAAGDTEKAFGDILKSMKLSGKQHDREVTDRIKNLLDNSRQVLGIKPHPNTESSEGGGGEDGKSFHRNGSSDLTTTKPKDEDHFPSRSPFPPDDFVSRNKFPRRDFQEDDVRFNLDHDHRPIEFDDNRGIPTEEGGMEKPGDRTPRHGINFGRHRGGAPRHGNYDDNDGGSGALEDDNERGPIREVFDYGHHSNIVLEDDNGPPREVIDYGHDRGPHPLPRHEIDIGRHIRGPGHHPHPDERGLLPLPPPHHHPRVFDYDRHDIHPDDRRPPFPPRHHMDEFGPPLHRDDMMLPPEEGRGPPGMGGVEYFDDFRHPDDIHPGDRDGPPRHFDDFDDRGGFHSERFPPGGRGSFHGRFPPRDGPRRWFDGPPDLLDLPRGEREDPFNRHPHHHPPMDGPYDEDPYYHGDHPERRGPGRRRSPLPPGEYGPIGDMPFL